MKDLDPSSITLSSPSKSFACEKLSRQIDECDDIVVLKDAYVVMLSCILSNKKQFH